MDELARSLERAVALLVAEADAAVWAARETAARQERAHAAMRACIRGALVALDAGNLSGVAHRLEEAERIDREEWQTVGVAVAADAIARA